MLFFVYYFITFPAITQLFLMNFVNFLKSTKIVKLFFFKLYKFLVIEQPFEDDEIFCKCNIMGCDQEILEIANYTYAGICRAHKGGICRTVKQFNKNGEILDFLQQFV